MVSSIHAVSRKGYYIAIVSTNVETSEPVKELEPAMQLLGPVVQKFIKVSYHKNGKLMGFVFSSCRSAIFLCR